MRNKSANLEIFLEGACSNFYPAMEFSREIERRFLSRVQLHSRWAAAGSEFRFCA